METKKPYYSIGQVAEFLELPQSVLRYWETVFDALQPAKSPKGSRRYSDRDLKILNDIKRLLYDRGFTIRGANKILNQKYHVNQTENRQTSEMHEINKAEDHIVASQKEQKVSHTKETNRDVLQRIIMELKEIVRVLDQ